MGIILLGKERTTKPLPRQADASGLLVHCSGGLRFSQLKADEWCLEPAIDNGLPSRAGPFSKAELQVFQRTACINPIAFEDIGWIDGCWHSSWCPIIPGRHNHFLSPANYWSNIAHSFSRRRLESRLNGLSGEDSAVFKFCDALEVFDERDRAEALALSISHCLRSMDIHIGGILEFYSEQLINHLALGPDPAQRRGSPHDHILYTHVQSFLVNFGAARDYLAALIAQRIGRDSQRIDCLARLLEVPGSDIQEDAIGAKLIELGLLSYKTHGSRLQQCSWLSQATELRNVFLHTLPYGMRFIEKFGHIAVVDQHAGLYKYLRPLVQCDGSKTDALDAISGVYLNAASLFVDLALASGYDTNMLVITDRDIIRADPHGSP